MVRQEPRALERGQLRPVAACARASARRVSRRRRAQRVRPFRRALPRGDRRRRAARSQSARRVLRAGAARPRDPRCALPAPADVLLRGGPGQLRRSRAGRARAGSRGIRHRRVPCPAAAGGLDRRAAHGRARRHHRRPPEASERWPAGVARGGRGDVRPHLVQAQSGRQGRRGRRAADRDRGGAGRERAAVPRLARRQRAVRRPREPAGAAGADERGAAAREAGGGDRLHRAADQPQARARARRFAGVEGDTGDRRRVRRRSRRFSAERGRSVIPACRRRCAKGSTSRS